ncbi:MAG: nitric oxide reductase activation protein NorD [Pseudomonadales bacterium]
MVALVDVESALTLFAEGIAGRYYHVKSTAEFSSRRFDLDTSSSAIAPDTLYVPEQIDYPDGAGYRVLVMLQLGQREFGTFRFDMATARRRLPTLEHLGVPEPRPRESDYALFFRHVPHPALLKRIFLAVEQIRIVSRLLERYPGLAAHRQRFRDHRYPADAVLPVDDLAGLLLALELTAEGVPPSRLDDATGLLAPALSRLDTIRASAADVFDAAALALDLYLAWSPLLPGTAFDTVPSGQNLEDALEWMQREARLEDWEQALDDLDQSLLIELPEGTEVDMAQVNELQDAGLRQTDIDLKALTDERENLKRRVDMERSALADAMGTAKPEARSYRYDEWDHLGHRYLRHWCRLYEERLEGHGTADPEALKRVVREHVPAVMRQLEQIRPLGYQRVHRVADGDELDFNALIEARQDVRAGISPDERVYSRRDRVHRDVCAAFLVDLSASTDDPIEPPEPPPPLPEGVEINLRDPYDDDLSLNLAAAEERRRIIDVQRESMLVMSAALERLGDSYGIYGFSGYGRDCVEFYVAKEPDEPFTGRTLEAIASMRPRRSTRMGPAIRHAAAKLVASGNAMKLLIILSDGFPQDSDYGPIRGDHEYGLMDTAKALTEARIKGIEVFCVTVDKSGNDYLKRMCPPHRYLIIDEIEDLPEKLSTVYQTLSGR